MRTVRITEFWVTINVFLVLPWLFSPACAFLNQPLDVSDIFRGNTKHDIQEFTLEEKTEYRLYHHLKQVNEREKDKEILKRMKPKS